MSFTATVANPPASVGAVRLGKLPPWASLGILFGVVGVLSIIAWGPIGVSGTYPRIISEAMRVAAPGYAAANPYLVKMGSILVPETFILLGLVVGGLLGARLDRVKAPKMEATYPAAAPAVTYLGHDAALGERLHLRRRCVRHRHRDRQAAERQPLGRALIMKNIYAIFIGVAMGFLIQRIRASSPAAIAANLRLENLSIIKFMAMTIAVGMMLVYALSLVIPDALNFSIKPTYVVGVLLGGLVFGVGFALSGYCPGTCAVGIGEGRRDAVFALLGGIAGALVFTLVCTILIEPLLPIMDLGKITLADVLHVPIVQLAMVVGGLFIALITWLPTEVRKHE